MSRKFVIDGAPGSGKTTLLFGQAKVDVNNEKASCLGDYGFKIIPEAISAIADEMRKEGKVPTDLTEEFVKRTISRSVKESSDEYKGICFIERGLPGYFFMENVFKTKLPSEYHAYLKQTDYQSPIFVLEPIYSFDMTKRNKTLRKGRVATLKQRKQFFEKTISIYKELGYQVVTVPLYSDNIQVNNGCRIKQILNHIKI